MTTETDTHVTSPDGDDIFMLPDDSGLLAAEDIYAALRERASASAPCHIDASGVARVSTAVIQLLLGAKKSAEADGVSFGVQNPSIALARGCRILGVYDALFDDAS